MTEQQQQNEQQPINVNVNVYNQAPVAQLKTSRSVIKLILLSFITFGIYGLIFWASIADDLNVMASRYDGKRTMNFWLLIFIVSPITLGIGTLVWVHNLCNRIGSELNRRGVSYKFGVSDFWIFGILLSFTIICPFIYMHKLTTAMNMLSENFNVNG
ncbi:MAG: DUF4234 domain-containing protein [Oscillospiraceae bacterium]|nr:DUF4234 domain-containing protein [Oscillospiraceae bacterium]